MTQPEDNPTLNCPYEEPKKHYRTLPDGTLDYTQIIKSRRSYDPFVNTPIPVKQGTQEQNDYYHDRYLVPTQPYLFTEKCAAKLSHFTESNYINRLNKLWYDICTLRK